MKTSITIDMASSIHVCEYIAIKEAWRFDGSLLDHNESNVPIELLDLILWILQGAKARKMVRTSTAK